MKRIGGIYIDECPDCSKQFQHDTEDGCKTALELHRCDRRSAAARRKPKPGVDHASVALKDAMASAADAHAEWLAMPEVQRGLEEQRRKDRELEVEDRLRAFMSRGIPRLTALSLAYGVDHHDLPIVEANKVALHLELHRARHMILVFGIVGTGKTLAACRWLMTYGPAGRYVLAGDIGALTNKWSEDREKIERYRGAEALVVDEVKKNNETTAQEQDRLADLLQFRYDNRAPTVVIANMMPEQFDFGERLARRTTPPNGVQLIADEIMCPVQRRRARDRRAS